MPAFFFSVGSTDDIDRMTRATGWQPQDSAVFEPVAPDRGRFLHRACNTPSVTEAFLDSPRVRAFALTIGEEVTGPELATTMQPPHAT
jgi:hypothetical protein